MSDAASRRVYFLIIYVPVCLRNLAMRCTNSRVVQRELLYFTFVNFFFGISVRLKLASKGPQRKPSSLVDPVALHAS
ncbi:hypothetical protein BDY19DRAFT_246525 [Irpex rosettiformis]|uniref:Uncharacterized protein n=1 Tax=Irpex rosettiformis TaxID=378272 RepID=A0ACB8TZB1_9APHY|nr:hypothetical protein BDY19DRAFT_246525 [Irpex rosettiformis]